MVLSLLLFLRFLPFPCLDAPLILEVSLADGVSSTLLWGVTETMEVVGVATLTLEVSLADGVSSTLLWGVTETMGVVGVATLTATELVLLKSVSVLECSLCLVKPIGRQTINMG